MYDLHLVALQRKENRMTAKKFRELAERTMSPEARTRAATRTRAMIAEMPEIVARFPDGAVQINQFHDLDPQLP